MSRFTLFLALVAGAAALDQTCSKLSCCVATESDLQAKSKLWYSQHHDKMVYRPADFGDICDGRQLKTYHKDTPSERSLFILHADDEPKKWHRCFQDAAEAKGCRCVCTDDKDDLWKGTSTYN